MKFTKLYQTDHSTLQEIYNSYTQSFPEDERRTEQQFFDLLNKKNAEISIISVENQSIGYFIGWPLSEIFFLEIFEVFPKFRNLKYGAKILEKLQEKYPQIILEAEPKTLNEIAERRIGFYQRNGFSVIETTYIQPAYDATKNPVPLWLLANFQPKNVADFISEIYQTVYHL